MLFHCPSCPSAFRAEDALAAHAAMHAERKPAVLPPEPTETTMPECGYCHRPKNDHSPTCRRSQSAAGACSCGGVKRHKPGCAKYGGKIAPSKASSKASKKAARRGRAPVATNGTDPVAAIERALGAIRAELETARKVKAAFATAYAQFEGK